ncbi:unnamed protein product [Calicophoron daubneyi]|uniref:Spondin-1 n=1 Tax=Calicophoron daubneyi TaxID=300641 RepID=A0AAV2T832_CALDB
MASTNILLFFCGWLVSLNTVVPQSQSNQCRQIPRDLSTIRRPGDGNFEITIHLLPPGSKRLRGSGNRGLFWPLSTDQTAPGVNLSGKPYDSPIEYLPGREYQITVRPKSSHGTSNAFHIEAVYLTAVPIGTPESQEYGQGVGKFSPTICSNSQIGAIEFKYNFPRQVSFLWIAPSQSKTAVSPYEPGATVQQNKCVELRATVVPSHWHRIYFRDMGGLRHILCPAKDVRRIDDWPNYKSEVVEPKVDSLKVRSIVMPSPKVDQTELRDRYSESGFYGAEEVNSCPVQELPKPVRRCCACNTAIYRLIVQSDWQQQQHWKDWPSGGSADNEVNPSPHWSEILGASHSPLYDVFHAGGYASPAVDALCTASDVSKLESEFRNEAGGNILTVIRTRGIDSVAPPEQRIRSALFAVNSTHHLISFLTRLVPSPDWCTGLSRIDICLPNCSWPLRLQFRLEPWDAGVMTGNTYLPPEQAERLREPKPMCPITPDLRPNTPFTVLTDYAPTSGLSIADATIPGYSDLRMDDPSMSPRLPTQLKSPMAMIDVGSTGGIRRRFARLGTVIVELLRINEHESCTPETAQDDQGYGQTMEQVAEEDISSTRSSSQCQLSAWSPWGPCTVVDLNTCLSIEAKEFWSKRPPRKQRTRSFLPPSTAANCPGYSLKEEKTCEPAAAKEPCGPPSSAPMPGQETASAEKCQSLPWGPWSGCMNVSCTRPGMIYRWRQFPDMATKVACERYPKVSQVDTCWPPSTVHCDPAELKKACYEEPPTKVRLCVRPYPPVRRYYYNPVKKMCVEFEYVPECHLQALMSEHPIGLTRNMFLDHQACERLCLSEGEKPVAKREVGGTHVCEFPMDDGYICGDGMQTDRWYYNSEKGQCLMFNYSGCGGNPNNFETKIECYRLCTYHETKFNEDELHPDNEPNSPPMPVDCVFTEWSTWSPCSRRCGGGTRQRQRTLISPPQTDCHVTQTDFEETESCNEAACD